MIDTIHFKWTPDMSVSEETIDRQHQGLLNQVNKIIEATVFGADSTEVQSAFTFFDQYVKEHFAYEEEYMKEHNYPEFEAHKQRHDDFAKKYLVFKEKFNKGADPDILILDIEKFLGEWWLEHIGHEDKKYHLYLDK